MEQTSLILPKSWRNMVMENLKHLRFPKHYEVNLRWFVRVTKFSEEIQNFSMTVYLSLNAQDVGKSYVQKQLGVLSLLRPVMERLPRAYSSTADLGNLEEDRDVYVSMVIIIMLWMISEQYPPSHTWILTPSIYRDLAFGRKIKA